MNLNQHRENITKRIIATFTDDAPVKSGLAAFFPTVTTIESTVGVEVERNRQLIAVDVQRGTDANRNKFSKDSEKLYEPPMYLESWDFTSAQRFNVTFGQKTNPSVADALSMLGEASRRISAMRRKIERAIELQRSQAVQTGIIILKNGDNIDYKRQADSLEALTGTDVWSDTTNANPLTDLRVGCTFLREQGLSSGNNVNVIFGQTAFGLFMNHPAVTKQADFRRINRVDIGMPQFDNTSGLVFHGQIATADYVLNLWTYNEFYEAANGTKTKYIDPKNVVMIAEDFEAKTAFAGVPAIERDMSNAEFPEWITPVEADFYLNNWLDKSKKAHWFELGSAPLAVPVSIDRVYTIKVIV